MSIVKMVIMTAISSTLMASNSWAYVDTSTDDVIIDAPWRTVRDYLPVLFFTPQLTKHDLRRIERIELYNYDPNNWDGGEHREGTIKSADIIFEDNRVGQDRLDCAGKKVSFIDPNGFARPAYQSNEVSRNFWHYIARVPVECIGAGDRRGKIGEHYLFGKITWKSPSGLDEDGAVKTRERKSWRILRVVVADKERNKTGFVKFSPADNHYDIHYHTIAEQTTLGVLNTDAANKAFGGPLAMLMESAYALGLVNIQLKDGNWSWYKERIATTDHNVFFSTGAYDSGKSPQYGPTSRGTPPSVGGPTSTISNGHQAEFDWYRKNLGNIAGEEITLQQEGAGSHFLAYGAPHFEGPWHGGNFKGLGADNPWLMENVMPVMSKTNGFGYAAHPFSKDFRWSNNRFNVAIGLDNYNDGSSGSPILQANGKDFVFKGIQVWNGKADMKSEEKMDDSHVKDFDPFTQRDSKEVFLANDSWDKSITKNRDKFYKFVRRGLNYSFKQRPNHHFIRKLYMSAGTDAHGDFNYHLSNHSLIYAKSGIESVSADNNAFGRARTYTLTSERKIKPGEEIETNQRIQEMVNKGEHGPGVPKPPVESVMAYREGNTVLTDGPICTMAADTNCKFNSDPDHLSWHENSCKWENYDGMIGGQGNFDGVKTMLAQSTSNGIWLNTKWKGRNDYFSENDGDPDAITFSIDQITPSSRNIISSDITSGSRGKEFKTKFTQFKNASTTAFALKGVLGDGERKAMCLTNPIWTISADITLDAPTMCPIKPGDLKVSVKFGASMDPTVREDCPDLDCMAPEEPHDIYNGAQIIIKPLDRNGQSTSKVIKLSNQRRWSDTKSRIFFTRTKKNTIYSATNAEPIPCVTAESTQGSSGRQRYDDRLTVAQSPLSSYAVIVKDVHDMHLNPLNAIATTFKVRNPESVVTSGGVTGNSRGGVIID